MQKIFFGIATISILSLTSCASSYHWEHESKGRQELAQDKLDCIKKVNDITQPKSSQTTVNVNGNDPDSESDQAGAKAIGGMLARAFGAVDPKQEVFDLCMESHGWYRADANGQRSDR